MPENKLLKSISAFMLLVGSRAFCQALPSVTQDRKNSQCSNIVALAGNVSVNCSSLTAAQRKLIESIPALLHKLLSEQPDPKIVMDKLDEIGRDAKKLGRGGYSVYDFIGRKREQRPGFSGVIIGEEFAVFQNIRQLRDDKKWKELLDVTEEQIKKTPEWLTPYLFSGIANANLGNTSAAIERLKFVREEASGDPDYDDADRILHQLQQ